MAVIVNAGWVQEAMARGGSEFLDKIGGDIEHDAIGFAPFGVHDTMIGDKSHLKECIGHEMRGPMTVRVGTGVGGKPHSDHAVFVELGTRPHLIAIKTKKVLTDGASFFGRIVRHPGTVAQPFLAAALYQRRSP